MKATVASENPKQLLRLVSEWFRLVSARVDWRPYTDSYVGIHYVVDWYSVDNVFTMRDFYVEFEGEGQ